MRNPQGYVQIVGDATKTLGVTNHEGDSITCGHCNVVVLVKPGFGPTVYLYPQMDGTVKEEAGAFCRVCMKPVCLRCHAKGHCTPLMRRIERMEARSRFLAQVGV